MANFNWDEFDYVDEEQLADGEEVVSSLAGATAVPKEFDWSQYDESPEEIINPNLKEGLRHLARGTSRVIEQGLGLGGDIIKGLREQHEGLGEFPPIKFINQYLPENFTKKEKDFVDDLIDQGIDYLPDSEFFKNVSSYITNGFTDPQSASEEFGDEIMGLATTIYAPYAKDPGKLWKFTKSAMKAAGIKGISKGAEWYGLPKEYQTGLEGSLLFLTSAMTKPTASRFVSDQYKKARQAIPKNTMVRTGELSERLKGVRTKLEKGLGKQTATKAKVLSDLEAIEKKAAGGAMPIDDLVEAYHDINENMTSKNLFTELDKKGRKQLRQRYELLKREIGDEIKKYGKNNPEFLDLWEGANEAYSIIEKSKLISNWLESKIGKLPKNIASGVALELFLGFPQAAAGTVGAATALKAGELFSRVARSSKLQKHYLNVIKESIAENLPAVTRELAVLERELKKDMEKNPNVRPTSSYQSPVKARERKLENLLGIPTR